MKSQTSGNYMALPITFIIEIVLQLPCYYQAVM